MSYSVFYDRHWFLKYLNYKQNERIFISIQKRLQCGAGSIA